MAIGLYLGVMAISPYGHMSQNGPDMGIYIFLIFCSLDMDLIPADKSAKSDENKPKPSWKKATEEEKHKCTHNLEEQLSSIQGPVGLRSVNVNCQDADSFITSFLECVESKVSAIEYK